MRRLMVLVLLALGWVALSPATAYACDTPAPQRPQQLKQATAVFTGTVSQVTASPADAGVTTLYVVKVDRVYKGARVTSEVTVSSPTKRDKCGLVGIRKGSRYLFVARSVTGADFQARSWQGTQAISPEVRADVEGVLGKGTLPADQQTTPEETEVTTQRVDDSAPPGATKAVAPGLLLALIGGVVLVLARFLGRSRRA
ncbi:hypothetical protein [Nocardioides sp. Root151]|uniref:hypothetical protein n=1 Tax=Nocardioides sp. Root151 TaxID=1736475 RepID=UPI000703247C|nr:hypothetical protein [Nocardioides sp. Root151]KQZ76095.1 hypothetical protein ASD66_07415 [Nocardioides sp. Root151]